MTKILKLFSVVLVASVLLSACSSNTLHSESIPIAGRAWKQGVKTEFKVPIKDTAQLYDVVLTVRTTSDYPYSNLWMYLTVDGPLGKSKRFPLEIITADVKGQWMGEKSGSTVAFSKVITHDRFPKNGTYRFSFEQASTDKVLPEVMDLTLELFAKEK
jgi:gliding motility-associated lipoprotein GldH